MAKGSKSYNTHACKKEVRYDYRSNKGLRYQLSAVRYAIWFAIIYQKQITDNISLIQPSDYFLELNSGKS